jgi:glycosyltransferase involved in cell wall biosynthesis
MKTKIKFENVDFNSTSGPNNFGSKLRRALESGSDFQFVESNPDVQISFIESHNNFDKTILRLDGIYFNSEFDWKKQNYNIEKSYNDSKSVVIQSMFDLELITKYFGKREGLNVIRNGTCKDLIDKIPEATINLSNEDSKIWLSASSWRPHKRLNENIRIFNELSDENDVMLIAGPNTSNIHDTDRIKYIGNLSWENLISLMKVSDNFIHAAWLDHCPNVVVDAKAAGCKLYCSSAGGTKELASEKDTVFIEEEWDFKPCKLYEPPKLNLDNFKSGIYAGGYDIKESAVKYKEAIKGVLGW